MFDTLLALAAQADGPGYHGPPPWWPIFPIFWLLVLVAVAVTVFTIRRRRWGGGCGYGPGYGQGRSGLERLAERYAAGEIDEEEYRSRRSVLEEQFKRGQ